MVLQLEDSAAALLLKVIEEEG
jgi:hypothetical protein